jgi:hypothetical protein
MLRRPLWIMTLVSSLILAGTVYGWAQQAAPKPFTRIGTLHNISAETVLIEDALYAVSNHLQVYLYDPAIKDPQELRNNARGQSRSTLREGMKVGYTIEGEGGGKRGTLTEVWVIPAGSLPTLQSKE